MLSCIHVQLVGKLGAFASGRIAAPKRRKEETGSYDSTIGGTCDAVFCLFEEKCSGWRGSAYCAVGFLVCFELFLFLTFFKKYHDRLHIFLKKKENEKVGYW